RLLTHEKEAVRGRAMEAGRAEPGGRIGDDVPRGVEVDTVDRRAARRHHTAEYHDAVGIGEAAAVAAACIDELFRRRHADGQRYRGIAGHRKVDGGGHLVAERPEFRFEHDDGVRTRYQILNLEVAIRVHRGAVWRRGAGHDLALVVERADERQLDA